MKPRAKTTLLLLCMGVACAACGRTPVAPMASLEPTPPTTPPPPAAPVTTPAEATAPFNRTLALEGIRFAVESPNRPGGNTVRIATEGLANGASIIDRDIPGAVVGAEVGDLDADGSPEIYVYVGASDTSRRASLVAYSANRGKSLGDIYLPPIEDAPGAAIGFVGPEEMSVVETSLARRFPIEGGKTRQLRYRLHAGEAGWQLRLERTDES
jgi:hypothetical protein